VCTEKRVRGNRGTQWPQKSQIGERKLHDRIRTTKIGQESSNIRIPAIAELFFELLPIGTGVIACSCNRSIQKFQKKCTETFACNLHAEAERLTERKMALAQAANAAEWTKNDGCNIALMLPK
jgi:hypothetical protein